MRIPKKIEVVIPAQEFDSDVYTSPCGCYLFKALEKLKIPVEAVGSNGRVHMKDYSVYHPVDHFDAGVLRENFSKGIETKLTLFKS